MTAQAPAASVLERYEPVIGIEVHCQLRTESKMFCSCSTAYDGARPNSHVCPVCLGLPGALPVINQRAVELVLATGAAIGATTPDATRWDRKNYFYPDLPKGYQISQYDLPLAAAGALTFDTSDGPVTVRITRAHLEEDTAKLVHADGPNGERLSLVDFNRSGVPLMEVVTEPDVRTAEQARRYAEELQLLLRTIGASDADMERGQLRVEANVSLRPRGTEAFGTRVEVKNMNSFRSVERAVAFEIERQAAILDAGEHAAHGDPRLVRRSRRDLPHAEQGDVRRLPLLPGAGPAAAARRRRVAARDPGASSPELPAARRARYRDGARAVGVRRRRARRRRRRRPAVRGDARGRRRASSAKAVANWVTGDYLRLRNAAGGTRRLGRARGELAELIRLVGEGTINRSSAREVLEAHVATGRRRRRHRRPARPAPDLRRRTRSARSSTR